MELSISVQSTGFASGDTQIWQSSRDLKQQAIAAHVDESITPPSLVSPRFLYLFSAVCYTTLAFSVATPITIVTSRQGGIL